MGATHIDLAPGRLRELRGATLALIVERPGHGYEIANRLNQRLGPTWRIEARQVYRVLDDLAAAGLVRDVEESSPGRPRQRRVVYYPTDLAPQALEAWMRSDIPSLPRRPDVIARLASARPADANAVLRVLDEYEAELLALLEANDRLDSPARSWTALLLAISRSHTDTYLQGELQWVAMSRRRIREFMAGQ